MSATQYDVAVIGAGPAGSATAYFLAQDGLRVALLDKSDFPRDKTCGDGLTLRALAVLAEMGVLPQVEQRAFRCSGVTIRNSDELSYRLEFSRPQAHLQHLLILPRFTLDELLLQHAISAGAVFMPHAKVENITDGFEDSVTLQIANRQPIKSKLAVIATGANIGLLRKTGLLKQSPPTNLAARVYFENVAGLDDTIVLFFDGVKRPGYGWVFPTSANSANIGCGVFFDSQTPQTTQLRHLLESNPYLQRILRNARQVGPIKGHPLRTDFSSSLSGAGRILVVGEAIGLVNPITGEGIDYALESAKLVAGAILDMHNEVLDPTVIQRNYRIALSRKFSNFFALSRLIQRIYLRDGILDKALLRIRQRPHLQQIIIDACYGQADPISAFTPRTLWNLLIP
jgi:geranylgeranyl reductase family protein